MLLKTPRQLLSVMPAVLLLACTSKPSTPPASSQFRGSPLLLLKDHSPPTGPDRPSPFLRGTAKVLSVDADSGHAVLDVQGRRMEAYWQIEYTAAPGGSTIQPDVNQPPVGVAREPEVRNPAFEAQPGDTIAFVGLRTGDAIFLQGVSVLSH